MLEEFYQWLVGLFAEGGHVDAETVKDRMVDAGYGDVSAEDVYEAVQLMVDEGDVFTAEQSSMLSAYTGGGDVSQGAYAPGMGAQSTGATSVAGTSSGSSGSSSSGSSAGSSGHAPASGASAPPPPPPVDPAPGQSALDAAVTQITYVNNVTNNTYMEDNDVYQDNDTVVDSSVNQTIFADGDVNQDFDTTIASGEGAVAAGDDIEDSQVITGDNQGVIAGDDADLEGVAIGDGNTVVNDSDGAAVGDGATAVNITDSNVSGPVAVGGDATQAEQIAGGDAIQAQDSLVNTGDGDLINNPGDGNVNTGEGNLVDAQSSVVSGEGDVQGINQATAEAVGFGNGDVSSDDTNVEITDSVIDDSSLAAGQDNTAETESTDTDVDIDTDIDTDVDIDDSNLVGAGVSGVGDAEGDFDSNIEDVEVHVDDTAGELVEDM